MKIITVNVEGMICHSCEARINKYLKNVYGVIDVQANYKKNIVTIEFDDSICNYESLYLSLNDTEYSIPKEYSNKTNNKKEIVSVIGILVIFTLILSFSRNSSSFNISDALSTNVSFLVLFIIGVFSSLHCIGMCGGIMMSQSISIGDNNKKNTFKPSILYNLGRLSSYTILGGIVGALGSVFSLSSNIQAAISLIAGIFMIFMGFNMSGFKIFRKLSLKLPLKKLKINNKFKNPFIIGLLNGFMPCGPLQTMQLYALATGSAVSGALSMFFFALGTIPLMLLFGLFANLLSTKGSRRILKLSGIIIIFLGLSMTNGGLSLIGFDASSIVASFNNSSNNNIQNVPAGSKSVLENGVQTIKIKANSKGYSPKTIYIEKNIPTELIIDGERLTSCNNEIKIPSLNISKKLNKGENKITFTPKDSKTINYSCWMGMLRGNIVVVDDLDSLTEDSSKDNSSRTDNNSDLGIKFYGIPLDSVPTERLVKKTTLSGSSQNITITSAYDDFEPAAIIAQSNTPLTLKFNIEADSKLNGKYFLYDNLYKKNISNFEIVNGTATVEIPPLNQGSYGLVKDNMLLSIIEIHDNYYDINLEDVRNAYFFDPSSGPSCH